MHEFCRRSAPMRDVIRQARAVRRAATAVSCVLLSCIAAPVASQMQLELKVVTDQGSAGLQSVTFDAIGPITRERIASWELSNQAALEGVRVEVPASEVGVVVRATAPGAWSPSSYVPPGGELEPLFLVPERRIVLRIRSSNRALERLPHENLYVLGRVRGRGRRLPPGLYRGPCHGDWTDGESEFLVTCPFVGGETARVLVWLGPFQAWKTTIGDGLDDLTFELEEPRIGAVVSGRVSASPAAVFLAADDGRIPLAAWTDSTGSFALEGLSPGRFTLRLVNSPLDQWPVVVQSLEDRVDLGDLQSAASNRLTVELRGAQGASLAELVVAATPVELNSQGQVVSYGSSARGTPHQGGLFTWEGLPRGHYELDVSSQQGDRYRQQLIDFLGMDYTVLDVELLPLEGILRRGDDPVEGAMLWFGGMRGAQRVGMRSREGGVFRGFLPEERDWFLEVTAAPLCDPCEGSWEQGWQGLDSETVERVGFIDAKADDDGVVRMEIDLPAGRVNGRVVVVEEAGLRGVDGVRVTIQRAEESFRRGAVGIGPWQTRSEESGAFTVEGLPVGTYIAAAEARDTGERRRASNDVEFRLDENLAPPDLELRLEEQQAIRVAVGSGGAPVNGAAVWIRSGAAVDGRSPLSLDGQGVFWLPPPVSTVDIFVWADEFGATGVRRNVMPGDVITVELGRSRGALRLGQRSAGRLVTESGAEIELHRLRSLASRAVVDDGDEIVVRDLSPGTYLWCPSTQGVCSPARVLPWAETRVEE